MIEGLGCIVTGLFGNGAGSSTYSSCVGNISITRVGNRRVMFVAGIFVMVTGVITKFGAFFMSIPTPIIGGVVLVSFGIITAAGLSNLQFVNLNSSRNLAVLGVSLFSGMAIPMWLVENKDFIQTGSIIADQVLFMLLTTSMLVGGLLGCLLDNIIPGNASDRGILTWRQQTKAHLRQESNSQRTYNIPFVTYYAKKWRRWTRFIPICPTFDPSGKQDNSSTFIDEKFNNGDVKICRNMRCHDAGE